MDHNWGLRSDWEAAAAVVDGAVAVTESEYLEVGAEVEQGGKGSERHYASWGKVKDHVGLGQDQAAQVGARDRQDQVR